MSNELPRYNRLLEAAHEHPDLDSESCELFLNVLRTGDAVAELETQYLGRHGITPGRFAVMMLLSEEGVAMKPSVLAEMTGVTRATMTGLLDTLERDDMVKRNADPGDRRAIRVHATPKGREKLQELLPGYYRLVSAVPAMLTAAERKTYAEISKKIRDGLMLAEAKFVGHRNGMGAAEGAVLNG